MKYFVSMLFFILAFLIASSDMVLTMVCVMFGTAFLIMNRRKSK